ncbi:hypothetical protein NDU88_000257 [Pleurodeles waltl]|uniref:Uncharacterized protein n=1 Tax=Pleurodeles waltl TaxID=8319 RepID=A0AAV7KPF6_PLEWA|nr:hypothetical protein NDU88_000257 [Pleurodeles waltl]
MRFVLTDFFRALDSLPHPAYQKTRWVPVVKVERIDVKTRYNSYMFAFKSWVDIEKATSVNVEAKSVDVEDPYTIDEQAAVNIEECLNVGKKCINVETLAEVNLEEQFNLEASE